MLKIRFLSNMQIIEMVCMRRFIFFGFVLYSLSWQILHSQPTHSLADALALTLLNNPELNAFCYEIRAADARILQANLRPNPILGVGTENIGAPHFLQTTLLLSQMIELGGKRRARLQFAQTERELVTLDYEVAKRQLFIDTTLLFIEVLVNQQKITFLEQNLSSLQGFSRILEERIKTGKASAIEESNFTVLLNSTIIELNSAYNELKNSKNKLASQWNETNNDCFEAVGNLDWIPEVIPLCKLQELLDQHPQMVRSYFKDTLCASRLAVEKSNSYPDVNVSGGPRYLKEANRWVWVVGFSIPIQICDRNQGKICESYQYLEKIKKEREAIRINLFTELNTSYLAIKTVFSELNLLKNSILPAAQRAYDFSRMGYESARYNYLELLETERAYRTSKIRYLEALGQYHKALTQLEGLTGSKAIINNLSFGLVSSEIQRDFDSNGCIFGEEDSQSTIFKAKR